MKFSLNKMKVKADVSYFTFKSMADRKCSVCGSTIGVGVFIAVCIYKIPLMSSVPYISKLCKRCFTVAKASSGIVDQKVKNFKLKKR